MMGTSDRHVESRRRNASRFSRIVVRLSQFQSTIPTSLTHDTEEK